MHKTQAPIDRQVPCRLEARLLGGLVFRYNGQPLPESAFRRRKSLLLLLRLLAEPAHRLPVDAILELLWPEQDPQVAAVNLRAVLGGIRAALPDRAAQNPVVRLDASLAFDPLLDLVLDVDRFEAAATAGLADGDSASLRRALALYAGPLLPGLPYEEWVSVRRETLARLHRQILLALTAQGGTDTEEPLRALLAEDPTDEEVGRALMRLLGGQGRKAEALRIDHALVTALREELGVSPSPETASLHAALLEPPAPEADSPTEVQVRSLPDAPRHNLSAALSSFVGRSWEQAELRQLLDRTRLLTLTGPGGCGKTRLALTLAEERAAAGSVEVRLVELAPVDTGAEVARATAHVLGLREEPDRPLLDTLVAHLADRSILVLLDNCEQVLEACAEMAYGLLRACPGLRILATSRERLGLTGETVWPVPPLSLPTLDGGSSLAHLAQAEAVQLFVERVRGVRPGFALTDHNGAAVERICRQLDGIPLALELAAARAATLTMEQLAARLNDRFRLLTGGNRGALPRHQTLRAALDWSWDLLRKEEQALLRRLAVFVGGWTARAAAIVYADEGRPSPGNEAGMPADLLDGLIAKSLVQVVETADGEARYGLLETMRQYGLERLTESGELTEVRDRHLDWCVALAEKAAPALAGPEQQTWVNRLEAEHDNFRAALTWSVQEKQHPISGLRLASALWRFWLMHGHLAEGRRRLDCALTPADAAPIAIRASALWGAGNLAHRHGDFVQADLLHRRSLALFRELKDERGIANSLNGRGLVAWSLGEYGQAIAAFEESLSLWRGLDDRRGIATTLANLGCVARSLGDYRRARALFEEALALDRGQSNKLNVAITMSNLGTVLERQGDYERGATLHRESLVLFRELGDTTGIAMALGNLGNPARPGADLARAKDLLEESLSLFRDMDDLQGISSATVKLGHLAYLQGAYGQAERLYTECLTLARQVGEKESICNALINLGRTRQRRGDHHQALSHYRESLGSAGEIGAESLTAYGLESMAAAVAVQGDARQAAYLLGAAERLRETLGVVLTGAESAEHTHTVRAVRAALGEEAFIAAWQAGEALSSEQATALALA
jgi:predicted ATPase/DNA-binding SARP family transcriptional activator/Tfp pilus assembly protein PilF